MSGASNGGKSRLRIPWRKRMRVFPERRGFTFYVFGWMGRVAWGQGRFANGSRWFSGLHRFRVDDE